MELKKPHVEQGASKLSALLALNIQLVKLQQFANRKDSILEVPAESSRVPHPLTAIIQVLVLSHVRKRAAALTVRRQIVQAVVNIPSVIRLTNATSRIVPRKAV
jgi:hypothetical protein